MNRALDIENEILRLFYLGVDSSSIADLLNISERHIEDVINEFGE